MTTRDPRSRDSLPGAAGRDPTQSLDLDADEIEPSHPSLALGTHDAQRRESTRVESPGAQKKSGPNQARPPSGRPPPVPVTESPRDHIGEVLGSYRILELLGKGGMGYVFRAEHTKLGREVALKLLRSDYAKRRDAVARFFQEARTVNRVRHRNIVDVTDFVELDDGTTFIIMELLEGKSLGKWARSGVDLPRALAVLVQICDGLSAAHSVGVVHRDLKPDNIIVQPTSDGAELAKLLDFGVAKLLNRDDEDVGFQTAAGSVIGTPAYMSPEQAGGMLVDARSDTYSLGAIMYELFCGQPMFRGRSFGEYVRKHLTEMPVPPRQTAGGHLLDARIEAVILRCLEKDPNQRFQNIAELRDALLGMLGGLETHPPGMATLNSSAVRPIQPTYVPHAMQTILPSAPIAQQHTPASGMHPSQFFDQYRSQMHHSQLSQIQMAQPPATPWWVWFVGGAVAVGLGIGAAVWYAGRSDTPLQPVVQATTPPPQVSPVVTPDPPPIRPKLVELKFDSLPSGGVYEDGHSAELCRTPCTFNVDLTSSSLELSNPDGADKRTYLVRAEGYKDQSVVVELSGPKHDFKVTLERVEPVADTKPETTGKDTTKGPNGRKLLGKKTPITKPDTKPDKTDVKPDPTPDPDDKKPGGKEPIKKIDPTDLADPFKKKPVPH